MRGMQGLIGGMVKVRVITDTDDAQRVSERVVQALEEEGFQVIEWTEPIPCKPPDEDKSRVYLTALPNAPLG